MSNTEVEPTKKVYSVSSMATAYELSPQAIRNEINAGRLSAKYYGRRQMIDPLEAERWFKALPSERP
jgi:hypothetical protein